MDSILVEEKKPATPPVRQADIIPSFNLRRFFNTGLFSDLTLKFSGRSVQVHKTILCSKSRWFSRALEGSFSESTGQQLEIHDDAPDGVWGMLRFFYDLDPLLGEEDEAALGPGVTAFVRLKRATVVFVVADKYDIANLTIAMKEKFSELATRHWVDMFVAGKLPELLDEVYSHDAATEGFRETVKKLVYTNLHKMHEKSPLTLRELLEKHPELAVDISMLAADPKKLKELGDKDYQTRPLLHLAAQRGDMDEVVKLLDGGMDINIQDHNGETALHLAAKYGQAATARLLVISGANVNAVSKRYARGTPMMWAKLRGHRDVKEVLERADALDFPQIDGLDD